MLDDINASHLRLVLVRHSSRTAARRQRRELAARCGYMEPSCTTRREIDSAVAQFRATAGLRMSSFRRSKNSSASVFQAAEESFFFMNERGKRREKKRLWEYNKETEYQWKSCKKKNRRINFVLRCMHKMYRVSLLCPSRIHMCSTYYAVRRRWRRRERCGQRRNQISEGRSKKNEKYVNCSAVHWQVSSFPPLILLAVQNFRANCKTWMSGCNHVNVSRLNGLVKFSWVQKTSLVTRSSMFTFF